MNLSHWLSSWLILFRFILFIPPLRLCAKMVLNNTWVILPCSPSKNVMGLAYNLHFENNRETLKENILESEVGRRDI